MFYGREKELSYLNDKYSSNKPQFIAIYGRRRIGKTALIKEFVKNKNHVFYSAVQSTDYMQLKKITGLLNNTLKAETYTDSFSDWEKVFKFIGNNTKEDDKLIFVIDEFPYMVEGNSSIPSILQNVWDNLLKDKNIMIIICGSSMSFMTNQVLSEKKPLFGRTTGILVLKELDFPVSRNFFGKGSLELHMNYYSVFSGVPYYLEFIDPKKSFKDNILSIVMSNGAPLFNEAEFLLRQEFREVSNYYAIIESIAMGDTRLNDIFQRTNISQNKLSYYLNGLIELDFIKKEYPVTIKTKHISKTRSGLYKLKNSFLIFYFQFVYPYISEINEGNEYTIFDDIVEKRVNELTSKVFEDVSINYLRSLSVEKKLPLNILKIGRWWDKTSEIDIVGYDKDNNFLFAECKWRNEKVGLNIYHSLKEKSYKIDNKVNNRFYYIISKSGFTDSLLKLSQTDNSLNLISANDMF